MFGWRRKKEKKFVAVTPATPVEEQPSTTGTYEIVKNAIDDVTKMKSRAKTAAHQVVVKSDEILPKDK